MTDARYDEIRSIKDFESLVEYLRDELDWPFGEDLEIEDLAFDYEPEELGLDKGYEVRVKKDGIKQIRPVSGKLPWGIFYVDFEAKRLPVVVLRRALRALRPKKRASAASAYQATWEEDDLLFIAATGEEGNRGVSFVHFEKAEEGLPRLKTIAWDEQETHFFYLRQNIARLSWPRDEDDSEGWREQWASAFTTEHREVVRTSKELSSELARLARNTRDLIRRVYNYEAPDGALHKLHESFRTVLFEDLDEDGFADMVAQTISYGLFSARATGEPVLGLSHLEAMVPNTNPFLKELFAEFVSMSGSEKHQIDFDELGVSELVEMLNDVNVEAVLQDFSKQTGGGTQDPVIYFYEDFLKDYDNAQKVKRGEFYTPKPVVSYIVRSVDRVLRDELGCPDGLADTSTMEWNGEIWPKVMILDPATGTGTFLETVIEVVYETMTEKWKKEGQKQSEMHAAWNEYVPKHLLPRLHGFELMMAPYSVAHMKLGLKLKETGYEFGSDERLRVYLTNTLEEPQDFSGRLYADFLAHEAEAANRAKKEVPVTVVIGNPPYSVTSFNQGSWINSLCERYKEQVRSIERQIQALSDDYVKFFRYAEWRIEQTGTGVVGLITNNGYLDGHLFVGMRQSLMSTFDSLYIANLHGNIRTGERTPAGDIDENVFDIQTGVTVSILARKQSKSPADALLHYRDFWGNRASKYQMLYDTTLDRAAWSVLQPEEPQNLFLPMKVELKHEWEANRSLSEVFGTGVPRHDAQKAYAAGFVSQQDRFAISFTAEDVQSRVRELLAPDMTEDELRRRYRLCTTNQWSFERARSELGREDLAQITTTCAYRPFDTRWTVFHRGVVTILRQELMRHLFEKPNVALLATRGISRQDFAHIFVSDSITDRHAIDNASESMFVFPLFKFPEANLFSADKTSEREPNLAPNFVKELSETLGLSFVSNSKGDLKDNFGPEDVLHYSYAIFHSPAYRERYAEFLNGVNPYFRTVAKVNFRSP